jgi:outer membrane biosynthesis protein TonB
MALALIFLFVVSTTRVRAQGYDDTWIGDDKLHVQVRINGEPLAYANASASAIDIDLKTPVEIYFDTNVTNDKDLNVTASLVFHYQGIALFSVDVVNEATGVPWIIAPHDVDIDPVTSTLDLSNLTLGPVSLITAVIEVQFLFEYTEMPLQDTGGKVDKIFYLKTPTDPTSILTSVTGIAAVVATGTTAFSLAANFNMLIDAVKTSHKLRSIQKKASELRSLPNLAVLGALPALFALVSGMSKGIKRKEGKGGAEAPSESGVSEYVIRQRLRETAGGAWLMDKCPKCKRKWNKTTNECKKCGFDLEDGQRAYADLLTSKVTPALRLLNKKKNVSIKQLAKKTKSNSYNAGVLGAALVDTELSEITKVSTPFRSFVMNIAGLAFLIITWDQLLGGSSGSFQTTLTIIGGALSLGVIIALYFTRKSQIEKFRTDVDGIILETPSPEEDTAEDEPDDSVDEEPSAESDEAESDKTEASEESVEEEEPAEEESDAEPDEAEASKEPVEEEEPVETDEAELSSEEAAEDEDSVELDEPKADSNEEEGSDQLTPEELDKERM